MERNGYCKFRESEAFSNQIVLECCRNPYSFKKIKTHYKIMEAQKMFFPFSELIGGMKSGEYKTANGKGKKSKIIAIPPPEP